MTKIFDIDDPRIELYKSLRFTPRSHTERGIFVAEGDKTVRRLLTTDLKITGMLATEEFLSEYARAVSGKNIADGDILTADKKLLSEIVGYRVHGGVMALAKIPDETLPAMMGNAVLACESVIDAENVGAVIRSARAFGIDSFAADKQTAHPYLRRTVRVSMGGVFGMKYSIFDNFAELLSSFKSLGYSVVTAEQASDSIPFADFHFPDKFVLVVGNEGSGVSKHTLEASDFVVEIPVTSDVDSLNVAAATAVFCSKYGF